MSFLSSITYKNWVCEGVMLKTHKNGGLLRILIGCFTMKNNDRLFYA